jgi:hypothetical protein
MSAANPNPMEKSMVSVLVVANAGGGSPLPCGTLQPWWQSTTVVIPKPNKPDYSNRKVYRPIALLNCLRKVLEKLMASRLSGMVETHDLLHPDQIGGHPQRSAIDAAMALTHAIKMGRSKSLTTTALFLEVQGAFDNVSSIRLTSTMR